MARLFRAWEGTIAELSRDYVLVPARNGVLDELILQNDTPLFGTMPNKGVFVAYAYRQVGDSGAGQTLDR